MSPKPSTTSISADEYTAKIRSWMAVDSINYLVIIDPKPVHLRAYIWKRLTNEEKKHVVISLKNGQLIVSHKREPKNMTQNNKFIALLRRCLPHVDDENLYDEVMEVVYGK